MLARSRAVSTVMLPGRRPPQGAGRELDEGGGLGGRAAIHSPGGVPVLDRPAAAAGAGHLDLQAGAAGRPYPRPRGTGVRGPALRASAGPEKRRVDAREQFRAAYEMVTAIGAEVFAGRARRGLPATGGNRSKAHCRDGWGGHSSGGADRAARLGRAYQPGNQHPAVHQPPPGRMAPAQGDCRAGDQLSQGTPADAARPRRGCRVGLALPSGDCLRGQSG